MNKIEALIRNSIREDFTVLDREFTLENAMDILKIQEISTIVIESRDDDYLGYSIVTRKQIANSIAQGIAINKIKIGNISIKVGALTIQELPVNLPEIISREHEIIIISDAGQVIGYIDVDTIISELRNKGIALNGLASNFNGSDIEKFIRTHDDPLGDIDEFFEILSKRGFNLTSELKTYIKNKIELDIHNNENYEEETMLIDEDDESEDDEDILDNARDEKLHRGSETYRLAILYNPDHVLHKSEIPSPENPNRLLTVMNLLNREKINLFNVKCKLISNYKPARASDILRVHTRKYYDFVKSYSRKGGGFLGDSTYFTPHTFTTALQAAGGAIQAGNAVARDGYEFALALIRPPGHHATSDKYGGYCIFNNSAVLARYLQRKRKLGKIMIIDWDAHSANGTMKIFYDDPTILVISIHQDPHGFYPNTGFTEQMGRGKGFGYSVNVEMPKDSGDREYMLIFKEIVIPLYKSYNPDFIIGCNGFDAHHKDNFTDLKLTSKGYYFISRSLGQIMQNKLVILNEGGYHKFNGELTYTIINGLLGEPNPFNENYDSLTVSVTSSEKINKILSGRIEFLKKLLKEYHTL
jgi:acetoin utilization deacetylase AcuC-like enzyme